LIAESILIFVLGVGWFSVQRERVHRAERRVQPEVARAQTVPTGLLVKLAWAQLVATWFNAMGGVLVATISMFDNLPMHMLAVCFMYDAALVWLALDTFIEYRLRHFGETSGLAAQPHPKFIFSAASPRHPSGFKEWISLKSLFLIWAMDWFPETFSGKMREVMKNLGYKGGTQSRWEYWMYQRMLSGIIGLMALNVLVVGGAVLSVVPRDIIAVVEAHTRHGIAAGDPAIPVTWLNVCAYTEWLVVIALPSMNLCTFWDTAAGLVQSKETITTDVEEAEE
jgi:hypothetical protein